MRYVLLLLTVLACFCQKQPEQLTSPYVAKQADTVYWAVSPNMDSTALLILSQQLKSYGIGFKPTIERDSQGVMTRFISTIIPFDKNRIPPDTLLEARIIRLNEQHLWPGFANIDLGNTPIPLPLLPLGFVYDPKSGIHTDVSIDRFPATVRQQVEKDFPTSLIDQTLQNNLKRLRTFKASISPGKPAFEFALTDTSGQVVRLSDYKGKVVYLDFWAHWCQPCMADMQLLKQQYSRFNKPDLVFLSISLDQPGDKNKWLNTLRKHRFIGKHVLAQGGWRGSTALLYGINEVPTSFIIGRNGNFYATKLTPLSFGGLEPVIKLLTKALASQS